ncbi:MAG TPA: hypothetical protein VFX49_01615 [Chloroflexota bacterium]|nr:hypothetical protein [Chloroflexota bacterium]
MLRTAPYRPLVGGSGVRRRVALAAAGLIALGGYAVVDQLRWSRPWEAPPAARAPDLPNYLSLRAADLALTPADVAGLPGDLRVVSEDGSSAAGASISMDATGRIGTQSVTFRPAESPVWAVSSVWEPWTRQGARAVDAPLREVVSTVDVYRDARAADRAFAAWCDRMASTYRLVGYGPWRLPDLPQIDDPPFLSAYDGLRPYAAVALVGVRAANVVSSVWIAGALADDSAGAQAPVPPAGLTGEAPRGRAPMAHALTLAETIVRRALPPTTASPPAATVP